MSQLVDDLKAARALIADEAHWAQGEYACNASGQVVPPSADDAVRYCAVGAIDLVTGSRTSAIYRFVDMVLDQVSGPTAGMAILNLSDYNDTHSHAEVLALFDAAIAAAEAEEAAQ